MTMRARNLHTVLRSNPPPNPMELRPSRRLRTEIGREYAASRLNRNEFLLRKKDLG